MSVPQYGKTPTGTSGEGLAAGTASRYYLSIDNLLTGGCHANHQAGAPLRANYLD